jgi:Ca-activated chloride channel homolog
MPFATPLALLGLLFIPLVLAMYMLKLRRNEAVVPSTLLWSRLLTDVEANAPWQKLRRSLLLLLQLLLVIALALLAARPFLERPAGLARDLVIVVDASASMGATDVAPNRLEAAKQAAIDALRELPAGGKVSVIAAGRTARVVANGSTDLGRVRQAISSIEVTATTGDLDDALRLAGALAARSGDAEILIATDAAIARPPTSRVDAPVRVLQVGRDRTNQAIAALAIRTSPSGLTKSAFISLANLDIEPAQRRIEVYGDGRLIEARDIFLDPQLRTDVIIDDITDGNRRLVGVVEVRLTGGGTNAGDGPPDLLASDDRAWAVVPDDRLRTILLVSEGEPYLETALSFLPNTELWGVKPADYPEKAIRTDGTEWDLIIFEGALPATLPATAILAIAPPRTSPLGEVTGTLREPGIGALSPDEPVLRYVDLSTTHIAEAKRLVLPEWARSVIPGPGSAPLLYVGERAGHKAAVLAFEPRRSDLPLQVAFPILLANLTGELLGGSTGPVEAVAPGSPVPLTLPTGATGFSVVRPDGSTVPLAPGLPDAPSVTFSQTDLVGVYAAYPVWPPDAAPTPVSSPTQGASPTGPAPTPATRPRDPNAPIRFAVALFDLGESTITPGSVSAIEALGKARTPDATAAPGSGSTAADRPAARDELWLPILLLVLVVLCIEWAVYQRDALTRLWRSLAARLGRPVGEGR